CLVFWFMKPFSCKCKRNRSVSQVLFYIFSGVENKGGFFEVRLCWAIPGAPPLYLRKSYAFPAGHLKKLGRLRRRCRLLTSTLIFLPAHSKKIRRRSQMFLFLGV